MLLGRAVENLLSNALEAAPRGGKVVLSVAEGQPGELEVSVADDGPGIAPEVATYLSDGLPVPAASGLGLGLHVVQRVVEAHGGRLRIERLSPEGTRISLLLPIRC
jgi:signal transduction histidine kinase